LDVLTRAKKARVKKRAEIYFARMPVAHLVVEERIEGRDRILSLRGLADIRCISTVQSFLMKYGKEDIRLLLIDLSATEFINSPVWAAITLYACKKDHGSAVAIIGMPQRIRGSFEMMGLHKELQTFPTAEVARKELGLPAEQ
jgi:anti-anti-sigma regulatory factor